MFDVRAAAPQDALWCDGLALDSPTNLGLLSWSMKKFWDEDMLPHWSKIDGKIGYVFSSAGALGRELAENSLRISQLGKSS